MRHECSSRQVQPVTQDNQCATGWLTADANVIPDRSHPTNCSLKTESDPLASFSRHFAFLGKNKVTPSNVMLPPAPPLPPNLPAHQPWPLICHLNEIAVRTYAYSYSCRSTQRHFTHCFIDQFRCLTPTVGPGCNDVANLAGVPIVETFLALFYLVTNDFLWGRGAPSPRSHVMSSIEFCRREHCAGVLVFLVWFGFHDRIAN